MKAVLRRASRNRQAKYGLPWEVVPLVFSASRAKKSACCPGVSSQSGIGVGLALLMPSTYIGISSRPSRTSIRREPIA